MYLGNISGDFSANNMKKTELNGCVCDFSVGYRAFNTSNIINIHKYFMKKTWYKTYEMYMVYNGFIKKVFMGLLISIVNASNHT